MVRDASLRADGGGHLTGPLARGAALLPPQTTAGDTHKYKPAQLLQHTDATYERNLGHMAKDFVHTPNLSHHRPRGFGLGNGLQGGAAASAPNEEAFYTQPGFPTDPRYKGLKAKAKRSWTLKDTPEGLDAKLRLAAYQRGELTAAEVGDLLEQGSAGTFAGGASVELTPEEEQWVSENGWDAEDGHDELRTRVLMLTDIVNEFAAVKGGQTKFGLEAAQEELATAQAELALVDSIAAKYAAAAGEAR